MPSGSKNKIVKAAIKFFSKKGYDATSMREIAEAARVTKPMIYYHFKNKDTLYLHLFTMHLDPFCDQLREILQSREHPQDILCRIIDLYAETFRANPGMFQIIQRELAGNGHYVSYLTEHYFSRIHAEIASFLENGAKKGILRPSSNYSLCSLTLVAILMFHFSHVSVISELSKYLGPEIHSTDSIRSHILNIFMR